MDLLRASDLHLDYGFGLLLDGAGLSIARGERVCLVGRNGAGKSSLMRVLAGLQRPDEGRVETQDNCRIAYLTQEVPTGLAGSALSVVLGGEGGAQALLDEHAELSAGLHEGSGADELERLHELQEELDRIEAWTLPERARAALDRLGLDPEAEFGALSGGMKRQVLFARALLNRPDLLILDEPTNHLDIGAIEALERRLVAFTGALLFVTHDRAFLQAVATRILDLDRGKLTSWPGDYGRYKELKAAALDAEAKAWSEFDKNLAKEEAWIRQGILARRTRNEGRVRALKALRLERKARRERIGQVRMHLHAADRSGKRVITAEDLSFAFPDKPIVDGLDLELNTGDRVGIIGPNGCGKTTLIKLLLGELEPSRGTVKAGTRLEVVMFDQLRGQLDPERTVIDNIADGADTVMVNGKPRHIIGYLRDFLFSPERARSRVAVLSGGERNRLLLAKLFLKAANLLILDEPTNDLDAETLELLELTLLEYPGTLLLVSHDRHFLNNVVTSSIAFDADGQVRHYPGGYDDWLQQRPAIEAEEPAPVDPKKAAKPKAAKRKLSYKQAKALEALPEQIEAMEARQEELTEALNDPALYADGGSAAAPLQGELTQLEAELEAAYTQWDELETLRAELEGA